MNNIFNLILEFMYIFYKCIIFKPAYYIITYKDYIINALFTSHWDIVSNIIYLIFLLIIIISSLGVIISKNPVHSVFFLILVFLHISFLLLLIHAEFIAFLILIVYLGAIAVLFLFVIMMFNIHILESRDNIIRYLPLIVLVFLVILEISYITDSINIKQGLILFTDTFYIHKNWYNLWYSKDNIIVLSIIYNYYFYNFILASLILLVAMIGAIVLTLNQNLDLKKQIYYEQNRKNLYNSLSMKKHNKFKFEIWQLYFRKLQK